MRAAEKDRFIVLLCFDLSGKSGIVVMVLFVVFIDRFEAEVV